ncbi:SDR family oxidoreductase [Actinomadura spongiicola]|uniref:SDR family oxidoreductase n=1 Tax=Actinomadura spongiicola TaxID=2303421 RepID=A0A372GG04_9ACTN|nr:SDR family oxidoreductase [Actinomadura spongiicola]RFS84300.1 SDR family oxidoreductase [Actinomadura spongiicola]
MRTPSTDGVGAALAGRVAIVTGAARGIGRGYALRLARLGAAVAVVDRDLRSYAEFAGEREPMTGADTADEIETMGGGALAVEADLRDAASARRMVEEVMDAFGRIDVCVCNAGGGTGALTENTAARLDLDQLSTVIAHNLLTTVNTCVPVAEVMRARRSGKIVTVSSVSGLHPRPDGGYAHYAAAKAAIIMYTRCLAQELGPEGVTANVIAPGAIGTGRLMPKIRELGLDEVTGEIALRRLGTVEDCAAAIEFLATDLSDYVTGQVIRVDGGLRA